MTEPRIHVGLLLGADRAELALDGPHTLDGVELPAALTATITPTGVRLRGPDGVLAEGPELRLVPTTDGCTFLLREMTVGVAFHWEHTEDLRFHGAVRLVARDGALDVVNEVPLEPYLESVISSEMSGTSPASLLRAHAIISRSWLLAQLEHRGAATPPPPPREEDGVTLIVRWYDREDHVGFDVCADDHCQRYQGVTRQPDGRAARAVRETRGVVLTDRAGRVVDARFSKCCGGVTAPFETAWADDPQECLVSVPDLDGEPAHGPLTDEANATAFIEGSPRAWCNTDDAVLLARVLPALDHGTRDFWRWEERLTQEAVRSLVRDKSGIDPGRVRALRPLARGPSGRIVLLEIEGEDRTLRVGKELEIRRLLSATHLYSSAFTVHPEGEGPVPEAFVLRGAGWGHGVGLCQIGAAVMAEAGHDHGAILGHYYRGAMLAAVY